MGDVLTFTPRPKPAALESLDGPTLRTSLEEAAVSPLPKFRPVDRTEPLLWDDDGNVVAAAGVALLALMAGA